MITEQGEQLLSDAIRLKLKGAEAVLFGEELQQLGEIKKLELWYSVGKMISHSEVQWTFPNGSRDAFGWRITKGETVWFNYFEEPLRLSAPNSSVKVSPILRMNFEDCVNGGKSG